MTYIATFYAHFGAIKFKKHCESLGLLAKTMPVPRSLSSSCGICTLFETKDITELEPWPEDVEKVVLFAENSFTLLYERKD